MERFTLNVPHGSPRLKYPGILDRFHSPASPAITTRESLAFDRGVRPMLKIVLPEKADAVIGFRADPELQARIEELAQKSTEGELTEDERAEYAGYVRANKFVAILRRQAQQIANSQS